MDREIVIKIPEETYKGIMLGKWFANGLASYVQEGTPLPKGHGALKDVDRIKTAFPCGEYVRTESVRATIDHEDTIIEADKEGAEK